MGYAMKGVTEKCGLTAYTLRYYEKEGLLPFIGRDEKGNRTFTDHDIEWITLIRCFRDTGMPIGEIRRYVDFCLEGDKTLEIRRQIILQHQHVVEQKIIRMHNYLEKIVKKLGYYDEIVTGNSKDTCNSIIVRSLK